MTEIVTTEGKWIRKYFKSVTIMASQSTRNDEVKYQPVPGKPCSQLNITVDGQIMQSGDRFRAVHINDEVIARIAKIPVTFILQASQECSETKWNQTTLS